VQSLDGEEEEVRLPPPVDEATAFLRKGNRDFRNSRFKEVSRFVLIHNAGGGLGNGNDGHGFQNNLLDGEVGTNLQTCK